MEALPDGWRWVRLGEVCRVVGGSTPSSHVPQFWDGDIVWITPTDLGKLEDEFITASAKRITEIGYENCGTEMVPVESVVLSSRAPIGHLGIATVPLCTNQGCKTFVPSAEVYSHFLFYALKFSVPKLQALGSGATFTEISKTELQRFEISLPPLAEQKRIAGILKNQMAAVERARRSAEAQSQAAEALPAAYLRVVFNSPEAQSWERKPFGELVENFDGRRVPVKLDDRRNKKGPYPYYGASGIIDYVDDYLFDGEYLLIGEDGANLVLRSSPIAFKASGKFWVNNHAHVVQPKNAMPHDYLLYFFGATDLKPYVTGAAQPKLTQEDLNSIPVPVPPLTDERRITAQLSSQMASAELLRQRLAEQLDAINKLPLALLRRAFNGAL